MAELVTVIHDYAAWLYALVLALVVRELVTMFRAGRDRRRAMFGLEREAATARAVRSVVLLVLLFTIGAGVYTVAEVIAPSLPERERRMVEESPIVEPPAPIVLPTDTPVRPTRAATAALPQIVTTTPESGDGATPDVAPALCRNPDIDIVAPTSGAILADDTTVVATVRFDPATGRTYSVSLGAGASPSAWTMLGGPYAEPIVASPILNLSPRGLASGIYTLRLALVSPDGVVPSGDECLVVLRVR